MRERGSRIGYESLHETVGMQVGVSGCCISLVEKDMREGGRYMTHKCQCMAWLVLLLAKRKWTEFCPKRVVLDVRWVVLVLVYLMGDFGKY
jgi:hypothetical protein